MARVAPLPRPLTPFVGRDAQVAALRDALCDPSVRLLTLTGPGGVGKTRLALQATGEFDVPSPESALAVSAAPASNVVTGDRKVFADGSHFVGLAEVSDPADVLPTIAWKLGLNEEAHSSTATQLAETLADLDLLLVLDNCEHIAAAGPDLVALLSSLLRLTLLVTSRTSLRVQGEHEFPLPPLVLPELSLLPPLDELGRCESVALFVRRARAVRPDFALTEANAASVAEICTRLDGLPLAIELAAARVKVLSPIDLVSRLDQRLPLLTGGPFDQPPRLQTMRAAIAWSYDLLAPDEQARFRRLSVFAGGFTLEAAEAVGRSEGNDDPSSRLIPRSSLLDLIATLIDHSLVQPDTAGAEEPRYSMLATIREFGLEQLAAAGEEEEAHARIAAWCVELAETAEPELRGPDQVRWLDRIAAEEANVRTVQDWVLTTGAWELGLRLAVAMRTFWRIRGPWRPVAVCLVKLLELTPETRDATNLRRIALISTLLGMLSTLTSDFAAARHWFEACLEQYRALGDRAREAATHTNLGSLAREGGEWERACAHAEEAIRLARGAGERQSLGIALYNYGGVLVEAGRPDDAWVVLQEALDIVRDGDNVLDYAHCLAVLGESACMQGEVETARQFLDEAMPLLRQLGDEPGMVAVMLNLSRIAVAARDVASAAGHLAEAFGFEGARTHRRQVAELLDQLAAVAAVASQPEPAARLLGAAEALRASIGTMAASLVQAGRDQTLAMVKDALGESWAAVQEAGRELGSEQAIAEALAVAEALADPTSSEVIPEPTVALTRRERDVLRLLVAGRSNREIADALFLDHTTIATHVSNLLAKLGVPTRAAAVFYALQHGLIADPPPVSRQ